LAAQTVSLVAAVWLGMVATTTAADPSPSPSAPRAMSIDKSPFGKTKDGQEITLYTIRNRHGLLLKMMNYGATVVALETPDRHGKVANITLGFDKLDGYLERHPYFGSTVGRYANRIAEGKFKIDGQEYQVTKNNGDNHLHGGAKGFDAVVWNAEEVKKDGAAGIKLTYRSKDGEEGYPGNLDVTVTYWLTDDNELRIDYEAKTDKPTILNLTNHNYWNLTGDAKANNILAHELLINAQKYVVVDDESIPTGELAPVKETVMDFTSQHPIGDRIEELTNRPQGYDHQYVLRDWKPGVDKPFLAARVKELTTGRIMEVYTTEPGVQFYTGNYLDGGAAGNGYKQHAAFCLETGHFPDSPNHPTFPNTVLRPGETYRSTTVHKFSAE
jgi:aldose 1-epimerase